MHIKVIYIYLCACELKNHYVHWICVWCVCACLKIIFLDENNNDQSRTKIQKHHYIKWDVIHTILIFVSFQRNLFLPTSVFNLFIKKFCIFNQEIEIISISN